MFDVTLTDDFQYQNQFVDTDNKKRKDIQITDNLKY